MNQRQESTQFDSPQDRRADKQQQITPNQHQEEQWKNDDYYSQGQYYSQEISNQQNQVLQTQHQGSQDHKDAQNDDKAGQNSYSNEKDQSSQLPLLDKQNQKSKRETPNGFSHNQKYEQDLQRDDKTGQNYKEKVEQYVPPFVNEEPSQGNNQENNKQIKKGDNNNNFLNSSQAENNSNSRTIQDREDEIPNKNSMFNELKIFQNGDQRNLENKSRINQQILSSRIQNNKKQDINNSPSEQKQQEQSQLQQVDILQQQKQQSQNENINYFYKPKQQQENDGNQEDVCSNEGEEDPSLKDNMKLPHHKISTSSILIPTSKIYQPSQMNRNFSELQKPFIMDIEDNQNSNLLIDQSQQTQILDFSSELDDPTKQSIFKYDPSLFQSATGYFYSAQNNQEKPKLDGDQFLEDIQNLYKDDEKKINWLQNIVNTYIKDKSPIFIQKINREIQGLQEASNLGDFFVQRYSQQREKKIAGCSQAQKFPVYIGVRGDGNCFYRAIIVSYLVNILGKSKDCNELENLLESIENGEMELIELEQNGLERDDSSQVKIILIQQLLNLLLERKKAKEETEISIFIMNFLEMVQQDHDLDYSLVLLCRSMIFSGVNKYAHLPCYAEFILPDEIEKTKEKLKQYKEDAEYHVISLSTEVFKHPIQILSLQKDKLGLFFEFNTSLIYNPLISQPDNNLTCYLLLSDLHYDLLFDRNACLTFFPSLTLFNNHTIYRDDLMGVLQDPNTLSIRAQTYTALLQEYEHFLKDQDIQLAKTKQSQTNIQSFYKSRVQDSNIALLPSSKISDQNEIDVCIQVDPANQMQERKGSTSKRKTSNQNKKNLDAQKVPNEQQQNIQNHNGLPLAKIKAQKDDENLKNQQHEEEEEEKKESHDVAESSLKNMGLINSNATNESIFNSVVQESSLISSKQREQQQQQEKQQQQKQQQQQQYQFSRMDFANSFYNIESNRSSMIQQQNSTPMGKLDSSIKKNLKDASEHKILLPSCDHSRETQITVSQIACCKLIFEVCYPCFKTRQIIPCPTCKKDVLSSARISQTTKTIKIICKRCKDQLSEINTLFNKIYCIKCDLKKK